MPLLAGPAIEIVYADAVTPGEIVTTLPTVPVTDHLPMFVVVAEGNKIVWATVLVEANSPNVLVPLMVVVDVPVAPPIVNLL
jgi:hypothetical protein